MLSSSLTAFSLGSIGVNIVLAVGLKYLWNLVALIQFAIFMREWQFTLPIKADTWLDALRTLALFEFIETEKIREWFEDVFGIESDEICSLDEAQVEEYASNEAQN